MYKYKAIGGEENIKLALQYTEFLDSLPPGSEKMSYSQRNLAMTYLQRYRNTGDIEDLNNAQNLSENTFEAFNSTDPFMYEFHDSLAAVYFSHYGQTRDLHYLSLGFNQYKLALGSMPPTSYDASCCECNIANGYATRYRRLWDSICICTVTGGSK